MAANDYIAFIVEGEAREPLIIDNMKNIFFTNKEITTITLPAEENIYMLWKALKEDDFETDIIEVLRERNRNIAVQLQDIGRDDFSEVYLFFDYDAHQDNLSETDEGDVIEQMLECFDNETENGKLYISYPMVEALRDYWSGTCTVGECCKVQLADFIQYKDLSGKRALNPQFKTYVFEDWKSIIEVYSMRTSCLFASDDVFSYEQYRDDICVEPEKIYRLQKIQLHESGVIVISAFPEFLVDYYGVKLWKTCVKHSKVSGCEGR